MHPCRRPRAGARHRCVGGNGATAGGARIRRYRHLRHRILAFDRIGLATATVRTAAYVTVLAIIPGRDIEIVLPRPSEPVRKVKAGTVSLALHRLADIDHAVDEAEDTRRMREFDACTRARTGRLRAQATDAHKPSGQYGQADL